MLKIDIISGFLGAGKTTLIKKIFESNKIKNEKVVIIENEFGEIGIDGSFLKDSGIQIKEINAGCICCSLVGDFEKSIKELNDTYNPDRIIIEPSGVGKLSDVINAVLNVELETEINILATVVDCAKVKMYLKNFGEFFNNQVNYADTIVVAKTDKCKDDKIVEAVELIKSVNKNANIITTNISSLDADKLVNVLEVKTSLKQDLIHEVEEEHEHEEHEHHHHDEEECCCGHHHHHDHDHDEEEDEHCCCHEHHHDEEEHHHDEEECCCGHHHHDHDKEEDEHCCCHEHHHDEEDEEHEHHHHDHHDEEECDDPNCSCHEHHHHHDHECDDPNCSCHHHHGHDADEVFTSWGLETPRSYTKDQLDNFLKVLANEESGLGIILRSKGILKASDNEKWYYFDLVAGDYEIRLGEPDYTGRIVVIGSHIDEHKIEELFKNL